MKAKHQTSRRSASVMGGFAVSSLLSVLSFACGSPSPNDSSTGGNAPSGTGGVVGPGGANSTGGTSGSGGTAGSSGGSTGTGGSAAEGPLVLYVGTGDWDGDTGALLAFEVDEATGELASRGRTPKGGLNSYGVEHPSLPILYVADRTKSSLYVFSIADDGTLTELDVAQTSGQPVFVDVHPNGRFLAVAHIGEDKVETFALDDAGLVSNAVGDFGTPDRPHSANFSRDGSLLVVPNIGSNVLTLFSFGEGGQLTETAASGLERSGGPRHVAFHPTLDQFYVSNENDDTVTNYSFVGTASIEERKTVSSLPNGEPDGGNTSAHVVAHPSGHTLYVSNRKGEESVVSVMSLAENGEPSFRAAVDTGGANPRHFALSPDGRLLAVGNIDSESVSVFGVDENGDLELLRSAVVGEDPYWLDFRRVHR